MTPARLALAAALVLPSVQATARDLAITDVTVVDTQTGARLPHRTVVIRDDRIVAVEAGSRPPPGAAVVRGAGRFLVPGLWDMVTHLSWARASALPALVASGVTAVRDQGGDFAETAHWAAEVRAGRLTGPTIFQVGPMLNGKSFNRYQYSVGSPDEARGAVRLLAFEGADGLEVERWVPHDAYLALMAAAKDAHLPVGGKVPMDVDAAEASDAGQATTDNLETIYDGRFQTANAPDVVAGIDSFLGATGGGSALFATFRRNGTAVTPCLSAVTDALAHNDPAQPRDPLYRYVARSRRVAPKPLSPADAAEFAAMVPRLRTTVAHLRAAGVTLLAGTDLAADRIPGFGLHAELDALADAGLSPLEVLQAATINPARVMRLEARYGTVAAGKAADLLLLDADPVASVAALNRINAVVLHGRLLTQDELAAQRRTAAALADAS